jgi:hypothetical protein
MSNLACDQLFSIGIDMTSLTTAVETTVSLSMHHNPNPRMHPMLDHTTIAACATATWLQTTLGFRGHCSDGWLSLKQKKQMT